MCNLRPAFFYHNFLANVGMVKHMNIIGANYGEGTTLPLVHPADTNYVGMGSAMASGEMAADYLAHKPALSPAKLEDFAKEFAAAYAG